MKAFVSFFTVLFLLTSCTITQHYSFNNDFSGNYSMAFDLSGLEALQDSASKDEDFFEGINTDSIEEVYSKLDGISKVKVRTEKNVLYLSYKFDGLESLTASFANGTEYNMGMNEQAKFSFEDGVFRYDFTTANVVDSLSESMNFFEYNVIMDFKQPIKEATNGVVNTKENSISLTGNLGEIVSNKKSLSVAVTFK